MTDCKAFRHINAGSKVDISHQYVGLIFIAFYVGDGSFFLSCHGTIQYVWAWSSLVAGDIKAILKSSMVRGIVGINLHMSDCNNYDR